MAPSCASACASAVWEAFTLNALQAVALTVSVVFKDTDAETAGTGGNKDVEGSTAGRFSTTMRETGGSSGCIPHHKPAMTNPSTPYKCQGRTLVALLHREAVDHLASNVLEVEIGMVIVEVGKQDAVLGLLCRCVDLGPPVTGDLLVTDANAA